MSIKIGDYRITRQNIHIAVVLSLRSKTKSKYGARINPTEYIKVGYIFRYSHFVYKNGDYKYDYFDEWDISRRNSGRYENVVKSSVNME